MSRLRNQEENPFLLRHNPLVLSFPPQNSAHEIPWKNKIMNLFVHLTVLTFIVYKSSTFQRSPGIKLTQEQGKYWWISLANNCLRIAHWVVTSSYCIPLFALHNTTVPLILQLPLINTLLGNVWHVNFYLGMVLCFDASTQTSTHRNPLAYRTKQNILKTVLIM